MEFACWRQDVVLMGFVEFVLCYLTDLALIEFDFTRRLVTKAVVCDDSRPIFSYQDFLSFKQLVAHVRTVEDSHYISSHVAHSSVILVLYEGCHYEYDRIGDVLPPCDVLHHFSDVPLVIF